MTIRKYVPASMGNNGGIIAYTTYETHSLQAAEAFATALRLDCRQVDDNTEVFVAYRDIPEWRRLEADPEEEENV